MLTHRNELLVRVSLTLWWHVLLKNVTLHLLVVVIEQANSSIVVLVSRRNSDAWLLAANMIAPVRYSMVNLNFAISPIPVHQ